ncbi:54S ribosomal protein L25, mitochondrial [Tulasnella sp. 427]|nr:54S ribosomal protein L25, mitochondrial [Tulasnella sp. 427]
MSASTSLVRRFRARELGHVLASSSANSSTPAAAGGKMTTKLLQNPFLPRKNPSTKNWIPPSYSLRRQADLVKEAKRNGLVHLLPHGPKNQSPGHAKPVVTKHEASPVLQALLNARGNPSTAVKELEQVDPAGIKWVGKVPYAAQKPSHGLYGKRRKMFKGRKWEREVKLRKEFTEKVVNGMEKQKAAMRWGRARKSKKPRAKYPI